MTTAPFRAYSPHPSLAREAALEVNLMSRTSRSVDDWIALIRAQKAARRPRNPTLAGHNTRLYRRRVFAQIRASTRSRVDLGLALGDLPAGGRLLSTGGFEKGDRITHRVAVTATD